jgi:Leucine-rich repeat (LRR) protein
MKKFTFLAIVILLGSSLWAQNVYYKYQVKDAAQLNNLYNSTGGPSWTKKQNWPVNPAITFSFNAPYGIQYVLGDTMVIHYLPPQKDTGIIQVRVREIHLDENNLNGALPALQLDSLKIANFRLNMISSIGSIQAPKLERLNISANPIPVLPVITLDSLKQFFASGCQITGSLVQWNTPALEFVDLSYNQLSAVAAGLNYPKLKYIDLSSNLMTGQLPYWNTPRLEYLNVYNNQLTSVASDLDYAHLYYFNMGDNQIAVNIPNWNFPAIKELYGYANQFTGSLPVFDFPLIEYFDFNHNKITGAIPDYTWPNLLFFDLSWNQITGSMPDLSAPKLKEYLLDNNQLTGNLQHLDFPDLERLYLNKNNLNGTIQTTFDFPKLKVFNMQNNALKGPFPFTALPEVEYFYLFFNEFTGPFPDAEMAKLVELRMWNNHFDSLPDLASGASDLFEISCYNNRLQFDDLLPQKDIPRFIYGAQDYVDMFAEHLGDSIQLTVHVNGPGNTYAWFKGWDKVGEGSDTFNIFKTESPADYHCEIRNPQLPDLILQSKLAVDVVPQCWENGIFDICITAPEATWESGEEEHQIQTTYPVSINDFLLFEGSFILDTVNLAVKVDGKFFVEDIQLPGGGFGSFTLAEGEYDLTIAGTDGKLTGFINDALGQYVPEIGGLKIKLDNLQLVGGTHANGLSLAFTVSFDNITPSCGEDPDQTTEIAIEGLVISTEGISVEGMKVNDLGLAPGFCLKELEAGYDEEEDKLSFGLTILTPFIEVGGGLGFVGGELDSISMKAELQQHVIPIGTTGIGIIGCEGRINSITDPPWNMRFGGIFRAVLNDDLFQITTSVEYIPPTELKLEAGDGKFFNPPFYDDWWLVEGGIYGSIDLRAQRMKTGGQLSLVPYKDEEGEKKFMATGSLDLAYTHSAASSFFGKFEGMITIPKLADKFPYDWLNAKFGLPHDIGGNGILLYKPQTKFIYGAVDFGGRIGEVEYRIELAKRYDDPDFFSFRMLQGSISRGPSAFTYMTDIPENTRLAILKATNSSTLPTVSLTDPLGNIISIEMPSADAEWNADEIQHNGFWTLYHPAAGHWQIQTDVESSVSIHFMGQEVSFDIEGVDQGDGIEVYWDQNLFMEGDSIDLFADDDLNGYDGTYLLTVDATAGQAMIPIEMVESFCAFTIQALAYRGQSVYADYATDYFESVSDFGPPKDIQYELDPQTLLLELTWTPSTHPDITGYVIELIENGVPIVIGMPYGIENSFVYQLEEYHGQQLVIYAYGQDGQVSCSSEVIDLIITDTDEWIGSQKQENLFVYPNPFRSNCTVRIMSTEHTEGVIRIYNSSGALVKSWPVELIRDINTFEFSSDGMSPGHYIITFHGKDILLTGKVLLME